MRRFAAVLLFLFCGLFLVMLAIPVAKIVQEGVTFDRIRPDQYLPFVFLSASFGYGFYAACRILFVRKPAGPQESKVTTVGADSDNPARNIGWAMAVFGLLGMILVWPQLYSRNNPWTGDSPITIFDYGPVFCFAFGSLLAYAFRRRTPKIG